MAHFKKKPSTEVVVKTHRVVKPNFAEHFKPPFRLLVCNLSNTVWVQTHHFTIAK